VLSTTQLPACAFHHAASGSRLQLLALDLEVFRAAPRRALLNASPIFLPQSYSSFRELPAHTAGCRLLGANTSLTTTDKPLMRFRPLQRLKLTAAATDRLTSPILPANAGFLTLLTP
jgi:hypothetical protein